MRFAKENLRAVASGTEESRVSALQEWLGYPLKQKDPQGGSFWFLHPGEDEEEAKGTCPIAVGFYPELNGVTDSREIQQLLTSKQWQDRIYGHYVNRTSEYQPVMYVLLPTEEGTGRVPLVLPTEGGLRQRNIQAFTWGSAELETRLNRIRQGELPIATKALTSIPLVERAFYEPIKTAKELAQLLAKAAREIEKVIPKVYKSEERRYPTSKGEEGYLHKLLKSFQQELLPTLRLDSENEKDYSFADIYAQTIAYALFTARVFSYVRDRKEGHKKETLFDRETAWQQLPETNPFLRRLFQNVSEQKAEDLGDELIGHIADIFAILRAAKMEVILQDFRQKMNREDIVIRFYEDFLAAYKPEMRERRGVYYTPEPVVSYLVQSVDILLKEKFNKPLGLADPEVMLLDPACGTGTFLLQICQRIYDRFTGQEIEKQPTSEKKAEAQQVYKQLKAQFGKLTWSEYVSEYLLPRIFGFELLMAPYAIAHLKLGLFLEETGYKFNNRKRLEVYLTNALDETVKPAQSLLEQYISEESKKAFSVKRELPIVAVLGNPPYSSLSANLSISQREIVGKYKYVDGVRIKEKNALQFERNIQDDYINFFAVAQQRIERTGEGILAFVSNSGFINNPTLRGMRQSLLNTFNEVHILDLLGAVSRQKEVGAEDENVFDIRQGVAISIWLKETDNHCKRLEYGKLLGTREEKYKRLFATQITNPPVEMTRISPITPLYLYSSLNQEISEEYYGYLKLDDIFKVSGAGIKTNRDEFVIDFDREALLNRVLELRDASLELSPSEIHTSFGINYRQGWDIKRAIRTLKEISIEDIENHLVRMNYRPFDTRWIFYHPCLVGSPSPKVMPSMLVADNIGLVASRQSTTNTFCHINVSDLIVEMKTGTHDRGTTFFPLYIYPNAKNTLIEDKNSFVNFTSKFNAIVGNEFKKYSKSGLFYFIYAVLHSSTYRERYSDFLKSDFPRVPLTRNDVLFRELATYGEELVALHLMKSSKLDNFITQFIDQGGNKVVTPAHPIYASGKVTINKKGDGFTGVPKEVWEFYVGGYPVCAKWLKDRKGRILSDEDIAHYQRIVVALQETIKLMAAIDKAIPGFPII